MRTHTDHGTQRRCDLAPSPEDLRPSDDGEEEKEGGESEQQDHHSREGFLKQVNCVERPDDERVNIS